MPEENKMPLAKLKIPEVAAKYEISDPEQLDLHIRVPRQYQGPISGITLEAADQYVEKEKGRILRKKSATAPETTAATGSSSSARVLSLSAGDAGTKESK